MDDFYLGFSIGWFITTLVHVFSGQELPPTTAQAYTKCESNGGVGRVEYNIELFGKSEFEIYCKDGSMIVIPTDMVEDNE